MKTKWYHSISFSLQLWFLAIGFVPIVLVAWFGYQSSANSFEVMQQNKFEDLAKLQVQYINGWFKETDKDLESWSQSQQLQELSKTLHARWKASGKTLKAFVHSTEYQTLLQAYNDKQWTMINKHYANIYDIFLIDMEGNILYTIGKEDDLGTNLQDGPYSDTHYAETVRKTLLDGKTYFSGLEHYSPSDGKIFGFLTKMMFDKDGKKIGVLAIQVKLDGIFERFDNNNKDNEGMTQYLVGADGLLRTKISSDNEILNRRISTDEFWKWYQSNLRSSHSKTPVEEKIANIHSYIGPDGNRVVGHHHPIEISGIQWVYISEIDEKVYFQQTYDLAKKYMLMVALAFLLISIAATIIARRINGPIKKLSSASLAYVNGARDVEVLDDSKNELGDLSNAFNAMIRVQKENELKLKKYTLQIEKAYDDLKESEEKLISAKDKAEASANAKAEFLATMSHEIRTPMNGVLGMLGLMAHSKLDETQRHQLSVARNSANSLLGLINDILDFSKVDAGKMDLEMIEFNLRDELGEFAVASAFRAYEKGLELILDTSRLYTTPVISDPGRIRQILTNLVSNAIKFTHDGQILVNVFLEELDNNDGRLHIDVIDSGIGIPEDKIDSLFDSFTQADSSTTRNYGGTGLGLAIVKKLCELMDGTVSATSTTGKGSTFSINIGVKLGEHLPLTIPTVSVEGKSVLIVDDNETNRAVLHGQLSLWGMDIFETDDPLKVQAMCQSRIDEGHIPPYDVALIDMQMPHMDGAKLGKELRKLSDCDAMKMVMMTSLGSRNDAKRFEKIGFNAFFAKPTTSKDLLNALKVLFDHGKDSFNNPMITKDYLGTLQDMKEKFVWPQNTRVLVVDDNQTNQMVAQALLENLGLNSDIAENGIEAIQAIRLAQKTTPYTIVLMDCQMPEMDGYEATQAIRDAKAGVRAKDVVIIAMTANAMEGDRQKCFLSGMNDYIAKPIHAESLKEIMVKWLSHETSVTLSHDIPFDDNIKEDALKEEGVDHAALPLKSRILVVDDDLTNQMVAEEMFKVLGLTVDIASDGSEALSVLQEAQDKDEPYTLVFMDCQMPVMDGYEASRTIRERQAEAIYSMFPIIAMTANAMSGDREKCELAGMNDYITKPIDMNRLKDITEKWLLNTSNPI